jgi:hypothetical protein
VRYRKSNYLENWFPLIIWRFWVDHNNPFFWWGMCWEFVGNVKITICPNLAKKQKFNNWAEWPKLYRARVVNGTGEVRLGWFRLS